ncbi:MAG TPA: DedA family protein [Chlorobaculum parvum]|uniref:DedA family protein n=1 Tax=Chlorobaculum parvum TaxID=274539 RepID=A0A7C5H6Z4_9CHLB|nr:DedA family protein [Chlorobaculum parvum]
MELLSTLADFILHIDHHLQLLASEYGIWLYGILFLIVFCETGLVVLPLLPGDSLLFAAGSLAAIPMSQLDPHWLFVIFSVAAILGDTVNYSIGHAVGPKVFSFKKSRFFNPDHLRQTHEFFKKYGGKTIIIARFVPVVRTFAPFVAGIGAMSYSRFFIYNLLGALLWVAAFTYGGFLVGQMSFFKENFKLLVLGIIVISVLIPAVEYLKRRFCSRSALDTD